MKIIAKAPGRVCLFGDHQDYLGLPVIAAAINRHISISAVKNDLNIFQISMPDLEQTREIEFSNETKLSHKRDYFVTSLRVLKKENIIPDHGYDFEIMGEIPINAGASSSSALVIAWITVLLKLFSSKSYTELEIADFAYKAEISEQGEPGGMMDQFSISFGNISYITGQIPFTTETVGTKLDGLILANSGEPKDTIGLLSKVKGKQFAAIEQVKEIEPNFSLIDASENEIETYKSQIDSDLKNYFSATIENHLITQKALKEFKTKQPDLYKIGDLMNKHHAILKNKLHITTPKINTIVSIALKNNALGVKINGSGGGGTVVILAPENQDEIIAALSKINVEAFKINVDSGAKIV